MQVSAADVQVAREAARAAGAATVRRAPEEGAVGGGTGMSCLGFKGGIGTASRVVPSGHTIGVLVMTNFGDQQRLTVDGVPVGRLLPPAEQTAGRDLASRPPAGSCITVIVTDAPLDPAACSRLARRAGLGLARTGSTAHHGSGEIFLALATGLRAPRGTTAPPSVRPVTGSALDPFFDAAVEATEEAVLTSLLAAPTVTGRDGNTSPGLPAARVRELLVAAGRIADAPGQHAGAPD
jgi:D-aminopeptidase